MATVGAAGGEEVGSFIRSNWTVLDVTAGEPLLLTPSRVLTPPGALTLALAPCALEHGRSYLITLETWLPEGVWQATLPAAAMVELETRAIPFGGSFAVTPPTGAAILTHFELKATGWQPGTAGAALAFAFGSVPDNGSGSTGSCSSLGTALSGMQPASELMRTLPAGNHSVRLAVYDSFGGAALVDAPVRAAPVVVDLKISREAIGNASALLAGGDASAAVAVVASLVGTINAGSSSLSIDAATAVREDAAGVMVDAASLVAAVAEGAGVAADSLLATQLAESVNAVADHVAQVSNVTTRRAADALAAILRGRRDNGGPVGVSEATKDAVIEAVSRLLLANDDAGGEAGRRGRAGQADIFGRITSNLPVLAMQMLVLAAPFEVTLASSRAAGIMTTKRPLQQLVGEYTAPALLDNEHVASYLIVPSGVDTALSPGGGASLMDVSVITSSVNNRQAEAGQSAGTHVCDVLFAVDGDAPVALRELDNALEIGIPLVSAAPATTSACATDDDCGAPRGACGEGGECECIIPHAGSNCSLKLACSFWDTDERAWSQAGVRTLGANDNSSFLRCTSTHTTEFAGIYFPSSPANALDELEAMSFELPCAAGFAGPVDWGEAPQLWSFVVTLAAMNAAALPFFWRRYNLRRRANTSRRASMAAEVRAGAKAVRRSLRAAFVPTSSRTSAAAVPNGGRASSIVRVPQSTGGVTSTEGTAHRRSLRAVIAPVCASAAAPSEGRASSIVRVPQSSAAVITDGASAMRPHSSKSNPEKLAEQSGARPGARRRSAMGELLGVIRRGSMAALRSRPERLRIRRNRKASGNEPPTSDHPSDATTNVPALDFAPSPPPSPPRSANMADGAGASPTIAARKWPNLAKGESAARLQSTAQAVTTEARARHVTTADRTRALHSRDSCD